MNKPFFIGNPIIDNYLKTPAGQEELKTAIEKIKSVELPRGLILTEKQYMQIASTFLCIEEKIAYDEKPALYKLETVNLMIWFALLDPNREATLNQERNKVKISYMLYNLYQHTFKVFKEVCHFEIAILGKRMVSVLLVIRIPTTKRQNYWCNGKICFHWRVKCFNSKTLRSYS